MKNILTAIFITISSICVAQELTADTPASIDWLGEILKALLIILASLVGFLVKNVLPLVTAWLKQVMHFRGSAVVADALAQAIGELVTETQKALADGVITDAERKALKARAGEIAKERLKNLSGFYKADLQKWVNDQLDVLLGKLLSRI